MKSMRDGIAVAAMGLMALTSTACFFGPDNATSLGWGDINDDPIFLEFEASADDLDGTMLDSSEAVVFAPNGLPIVLVGGEAAIDKGEDGVVSLVWIFQEPNKVGRKEDKLGVKQFDDVAFSLFLYESAEAFDDDAEPICGTNPILLDSCKGVAKVAEEGPAGAFKIACKDVSASDAAADFLDEELGDMGCEGELPTAEEVAAAIGMFLDNGKLQIKFKDDDGEVNDTGEPPMIVTALGL